MSAKSASSLKNIVIQKNVFQDMFIRQRLASMVEVPVCSNMPFKTQMRMLFKGSSISFHFVFQAFLNIRK